MDNLHGYHLFVRDNDTWFRKIRQMPVVKLRRDGDLAVCLHHLDAAIENIENT